MSKIYGGARIWRTDVGWRAERNLKKRRRPRTKAANFISGRDRSGFGCVREAICTVPVQKLRKNGEILYSLSFPFLPRMTSMELALVPYRMQGID